MEMQSMDKKERIVYNKRTGMFVTKKSKDYLYYAKSNNQLVKGTGKSYKDFQQSKNEANNDKNRGLSFKSIPSNLTDPKVIK